MIPKLHYISQGKSHKEHIENIQKACSTGAELVQLSLENVALVSGKMSENKFLKLAKEAREITSHYQTRLIISNFYKIAKEIKADGVFIESNGVCPILARKHVYTWQIIGGAAHTLKDCETLISKQVDYITLSPYRSDKNTNNAVPVLGIKGFSLILEALNTATPILGFGEITTDDVSEILKTGISGIAVSDEITTNFDEIKTFHQLLKASSTDEKRYTF